LSFIVALIFLQTTLFLYAATAQTIEEFLKKGRLTEARDCLETGEFSHLPSSVRNYYNGLLRSDGNTSAQFLKESLYSGEDFPQKERADIRLAHYYFAKGFFITCINNLENFIKKNPESGLLDEAIYLLGRSYLNTGKFDKAQASFSKVIDSHPQSDFYGWSLFGLGCCYYQKGNYDKAVRSFERLLDDKSQPAYPQALVMLSHSHSQLGNSQAAADYQKSYDSSYPEGFWSGQIQETAEVALDIPAPKIDQKSERIINAHYYVQVGAFSSKANANQMKGRLSRRGYGVLVESKTENKQSFHKVLVGPYATNASALAAKKKLEREEKDVFLIILK